MGLNLSLTSLLVIRYWLLVIRYSLLVVVMDHLYKFQVAQ